jgi:hypothetical protein
MIMVRSTVRSLKGSLCLLIAFSTARTIARSLVYACMLSALSKWSLYARTLLIDRVRFELSFYTISLFYNIGRRWLGARSSHA